MSQPSDGTRQETTWNIAVYAKYAMLEWTFCSYPSTRLLVQDEVDKLIDVLSMSKISRRLRPTVEPFIYRSVPITVGRSAEVLNVPMILRDGGRVAVPFHIPTLRCCSIDAFIRTVQNRPDLINHVKVLSLLRNIEAYTPGSHQASERFALELLRFPMQRLQLAASADGPIPSDSTSPIVICSYTRRCHRTHLYSASFYRRSGT